MGAARAIAVDEMSPSRFRAPER